MNCKKNYTFWFELVIGALLFLDDFLEAIDLLVELHEFALEVVLLLVDLLLALDLDAVVARQLEHLRRVVDAVDALLDALESLGDLLLLLLHLFDVVLEVGRRVLRGHEMVVVLVRLLELVDQILVLREE